MKTELTDSSKAEPVTCRYTMEATNLCQQNHMIITLNAVSKLAMPITIHNFIPCTNACTSVVWNKPQFDTSNWHRRQTVTFCQDKLVRNLLESQIRLLVTYSRSWFDSILYTKQLPLNQLQQHQWWQITQSLIADSAPMCCCVYQCTVLVDLYQWAKFGWNLCSQHLGIYVTS